jgi:hypothetical protein
MSIRAWGIRYFPIPLTFRLDSEVLTRKLSGSCKQGAIAFDQCLHLRSTTRITDPPRIPPIRCLHNRSDQCLHQYPKTESTCTQYSPKSQYKITATITNAINRNQRAYKQVHVKANGSSSAYKQKVYSTPRCPSTHVSFTLPLPKFQLHQPPGHSFPAPIARWKNKILN